MIRPFPLLLRCLWMLPVNYIRRSPISSTSMVSMRRQGEFIASEPQGICSISSLKLWPLGIEYPVGPSSLSNRNSPLQEQASVCPSRNRTSSHSSTGAKPCCSCCSCCDLSGNAWCFECFGGKVPTWLNPRDYSNADWWRGKRIPAILPTTPVT